MIPEELKNSAEHFAEEFGGLESLYPYITEEQFLKILVFPGPILVIRPWALEVDLRDYGYSLGKYDVFNHLGEYLYSVENPNNKFGNDARDLESCVRASHGLYLYLRFESENEPVCLLLWCCNRLSDRDLNEYIRTWERFITAQEEIERKYRQQEIIPSYKGKVIRYGAVIIRYNNTVIIYR